MLNTDKARLIRPAIYHLPEEDAGQEWRGLQCHCSSCSYSGMTNGREIICPECGGLLLIDALLRAA